MALIAHVYKDASLTQQFDDAVDTLGASAINGASDDGVFYVGTPTATNKIEAASNPGIDQIDVVITDANPGTGVEQAHIKLALTNGGLDGAVGGDPLALGAVINGGPGSAVAVHYRWENSVGGAVYTEITLDLDARVESAA